LTPPPPREPNSRAKRLFIRWSKWLLPPAALGVAILWTTELWPGKTQEAHGLVYESSMRGVAQVARYLSGMAKTGETRLGRFNRNRLYYRVCTSKDTIKQIFDHYEATYRLRPEPKLGINSLIPPGVDLATARKLRAIEAGMKNINNVYRSETAEMGLFGVFDMGPNWQHELFRRAQRFAETGLVEELGRSKTIVAFRPPTARRTTFITFWPAPGFNINNLVPPAPGEDMPGSDLADVPRCPGLRRTATAEELASFAKGYVGVYESDGPMTGVVEYYLSNMPAKGWVRQGLPKTQLDPDQDADVLFFAKDTRECTVIVRNANTDGPVQVIVMCRQPSQD